MGIIVNGVEFSETQVKEMVEKGIINFAQKNDPASTTLTAPALHGPFQGNSAQNGLFSSAGVRPQMFSTLVRPTTLAGLLGIQRSEYTQERLEVMTGVTAGSGTNATGFCGNPPTVGQAKTAAIDFTFGEYYIKTNLNAIPQIGQLSTRAEVPRQILNAGPAANPLIPDILFSLTDTRDQLAYELFLIGVDKQRQLEQVLITGNNDTASANTKLGFIKEFDGLDQFIKTGYTDARTGVAVPALDSAIITFGNSISSTIGGGDGRNFVQALTDLWYGLKSRARTMGMDGVQWAIVMREELFRAAVEQLAPTYALYRATGTATEPLNQDAQTTNALRLAMMNGLYLLIDGMEVPVVLSEGVPQSNTANATWYSDMYFVPVSWQGQSLLKLEYFPMDNQYATRFASFTGSTTQVINNGMYIVGRRDTGLCMEYHFASKMRLILETPWLAGRIDDITYTFRAPIRQALPGASYYANGGVTYRNALA